MTTLIDLLIGLPARCTRQFAWIGPLLARLVVGWSFLWSGWWKLTNLESFTSDLRIGESSTLRCWPPLLPAWNLSAGFSC
jgi:uncharacterized membrane protein YphA (DoxX/SURF4 family)